MSGNTKDTNPKDAVGTKKAPITTVSHAVMLEVGLAMLEGARKYGRHNYRVAGVRASVYGDAMWRHWTAFWDFGEDIDPASGVHHISKIIAGLGVLRDSMLKGNWVDDRPPSLPRELLAQYDKQAAEIIERYPDAKDPYLKGDDQVQANAKEMAVTCSRMLPVYPMQPGETFSYFVDDHNESRTTIASVEAGADHWVATMEDGSRWFQRFDQDPYGWTRMDYAKD